MRSLVLFFSLCALATPGFAMRHEFDLQRPVLTELRPDWGSQRPAAGYFYRTGLGGLILQEVDLFIVQERSRFREGVFRFVLARRFSGSSPTDENPVWSEIEYADSRSCRGLTQLLQQLHRLPAVRPALRTVTPESFFRQRRSPHLPIPDAGAWGVWSNHAEADDGAGAQVLVIGGAASTWAFGVDRTLAPCWRDELWPDGRLP